MRFMKIVIILTSFILISGCATLSKYKMISLSQVETSKSKTTQTDEMVLKKIQFIAFEEVIERSPNVKSVTRMTDLKGMQEPFVYSISPTEPKIVYQATEEINNSPVINLWKISTTGGAGMTKLTAGRYFDMEPSISQDGKHVFFSSNRSSNLPKIFSVRIDGASGLTRVTSSQTEDRFPNEDRQTGRIFFMSKPNSTYDWQIWYVNNNGSLPTQLKEGVWPRISPDGKRVLYCVKDQKTDKWKIWRMNSDGTAQTQLTTDRESDDMYPSWSPKGNLIVYASDIGKDSNGKRNFDIWLMAADGSRKTQLTTNGSTDLMPRISPDSKYIYLLSNRGFNWDIWRMRISR